jgi:uncharacterized protein YjiK
MKPIFVYIIVAAAFVCCKTKDKAPASPDGYELNKPEKFIMPESLLEISGITFYNGNNDTVYIIQDEEGKVFRMALGVKKQLHSKFARQGDYEDVAIINGKIVVLQSNGTLYTFPFEDAKYTEVDSVTEWKHLLPEGEYESMYGDEATGNLYVLCKNCLADNNKNSISGYIVHIPDPAVPQQNFSVDVNGIKDISGKVKHGFRPSALAKNPVTNEWFIVSAVNQLLVVADSSWAVRAAYPLNGNIFNQPEGLAFDKAGNMYISNEGDDLSTGNILKFKRH